MSVELTREPAKTLNWDENKQKALLGHLIKDEKFFLSTRGKIDPNWFVDVYSSRVLQAMLAFYEVYRRPPSEAEIKDYKEFRAEERAWYTKLVGHVDKCVYLRGDFGLDNLRVELTDWMKARLFHSAIIQAVPLYNAEKPNQAYSELEKATKSIREASFESDLEIKFDSYVSVFDAVATEYENALTFGCSVVDRLLAPEAKAGSLLLGDTTILLAPTNVGKTTAMITVLVANLLKGKSALFFVHEGRKEDIQKKIWCALMNVTENQLMGMYRTPEGRKKMDFYLNFLNRFLTFVPIIKPGLTVEEVMRVAYQKNEERKQKTGTGYHMLLDDYPAKLATTVNAKGNVPIREAERMVYDQFVAFAGEQNLHSLLAIQTNREGSKINKLKKEDRLLVPEDVAESYGTMQIATNILSINRSPEDEAANRLTYYIGKTRSNEKGFAVVCRTDYARATTHSDALGARYYKGASTMADKLDALLSNMEGPTEITMEELYG